MTNTWTKNGDAWAVQCPTEQAPGTVVTVTNRQGVSKTVTLGARVASTRWGFVYAVAPQAREPRQEAQIGRIDGILAIFDRVAKRLQVPAVELSIPATGTVVRVNVATARAKVPGSLTITGGRDDVGERPWYGRILRDGTFQPSREAPAGLAERLSQFVAEPARIAAEHGKLTGRCCFCRLPLGGTSPNSPSGRKSLAVGYGETCAANWGLPWGETKIDLKADARAEEATLDEGLRSFLSRAS
jgi:hypothetical protein